MTSKGTLTGALFFGWNQRPNLLAISGLAAVVAALYLPFLCNPLFFDDRGLFSGYAFSHYASSPFALNPRQPGLFAIAAVEVLFGGIQAQRAIGALLHCATALALYFAVRALQGLWLPTPSGQAARQGRMAALAAAALFAAHPVAVYGAGYLIQRPLVLATLFSLLSLAVLVRGAPTGRSSHAVAAGLLYAVAVLSKEHAILTAALGPAALWMRSEPARRPYRYIATYWAVCAPAAILVVLMLKGIIGQRYETDFAEVAAQISPADAAWVGNPWLGSALAQAALFFRYLGLWLWPRTGAMALDLRVDFADLWSTPVAAASVVGFIAFGGGAALLATRRGGAALLGFGLLWFWLLYVIEFSTVRFQEPFVLYRSYLWAPGLAVAATAVLARFPAKAVATAAACAVLVLALQAHERLRSFSSGLAIWEDAAAKLPATPVPGAPSTLYQLGREYVNSGQPERAVAVAERCLRDYPHAFHCSFARAAIHMRLGEYEAAIPYLRRAMALRPGEGVTAHHLGLALQQLGCREQALAQYDAAYKLGFGGAIHRIKAIDAPGEGLLPPAPPVARSASFRCAA